MQIGEKIKRLRTAKLMTQSELAGNEITRNMLSRIENGAAQPSLDTLKYIATKLNVSAGYLLAEASDEQMYMKYNDINSIKTAYLSGDFHICRDICLKSASITDDEVQLILAECTKEIAIEEFNRGNLHRACEYFDLALESCAGTIYNTTYLSSICAMYFKYMRYISATRSSNCIDETDVPTYAAMNDAFCQYAGAFLEWKSESREGELFVFEDKKSQYRTHLLALDHMEQGDYRGAYDYLHSILVSEEQIPEPMMYFIFCDLEVCCKEISDFKGAYEYSQSKIALLQKLLS